MRSSVLSGVSTGQGHRSGVVREMTWELWRGGHLLISGTKERIGWNIDAGSENQLMNRDGLTDVIVMMVVLVVTVVITGVIVRIFVCLCIPWRWKIIVCICTLIITL